MQFGEAKGHQKFWKKITGTVVFARTEIMQRHSNVPCVMLEKVRIALILFILLSLQNVVSMMLIKILTQRQLTVTRTSVLVDFI